MSAQRYTDSTARARMARGECPECGNDPKTHGNDNRFWMPINQSCNLMQIGVIERIAQYNVEEGQAEA